MRRTRRIPHPAQPAGGPKVAYLPSPHRFHGLDTLAEIAGSAFHRGIVLYTGSARVAFGPDLLALPLDSLCTLGNTRVVRPLPGPDA